MNKEKKIAIAWLGIVASAATYALAWNLYGVSFKAVLLEFGKLFGAVILVIFTAYSTITAIDVLVGEPTPAAPDSTESTETLAARKD